MSNAKWFDDLSARDAEMVVMYDYEKKTLQEIADHFNITRQRVQQIIAPWVEEAHYGAGKREATRERLVDSHSRILKKESTLAEEAKKFGLLPASLREKLRRAGMKFPTERRSELHGSRYRYQRGCRCDECREAMRVAHRELKKREAPNHGTVSGYVNYACRCDPCRMAGAEDNRRRKERRRQLDAATN